MVGRNIRNVEPCLSGSWNHSAGPCDAGVVLVLLTHEHFWGCRRDFHKSRVYFGSLNSFLAPVSPLVILSLFMCHKYRTELDTSLFLFLPRTGMEFHVLLWPSLPNSVRDSDVLSSLHSFLGEQDFLLLHFPLKMTRWNGLWSFTFSFSQNVFQGHRSRSFYPSSVPWCLGREDPKWWQI